MENSACSLKIIQPQTGANITSTMLKRARLVAVNTLLPMENKIIPPPSRNTPINIDFTVSEAEIINPLSLNDKIMPANIMENTPPKTIAGLMLFNLPHLRESVNPAKPSAEVSAARFPFIPLKERPPLTIIKIPIIEQINAHQVAFRIGSFSKGQAKIAVRNGALANIKAAFAMEVDWKA